MSLGLLDQCLSEFDREMGTTRRVLARVPGAHLGWRPHERSRSLGQLAAHVASLPAWTAYLLSQAGFDLESVAPAPADEPDLPAILARFDAGVTEARQAFRASTDARLLEPWTLRRQGELLFSAPRIVAIRAEGLYHLAHHRGQLSVYLRLLDVPLPPVYGPTADEGRL